MNTNLNTQNLADATQVQTRADNLPVRQENSSHTRLINALADSGHGFDTTKMNKQLSRYNDSGGDIDVVDAKEIGIDTLTRNSHEDIRGAAHEAQARCIENLPRGQSTADNLRAMGPSVEATAYGYQQMSRAHDLEAVPDQIFSDRVLAEGSMIALTANNMSDRAAHISMAAGTRRGWGKSKSLDTRINETSGFYEKLNDNDLETAGRAVQSQLCTTIMNDKSSSRSQRVMAAALGKASRQVSKGDLIENHNAIMSVLEDFHPSDPDAAKGHPLAVISQATAEVSYERERTRSKEQAPRRTQAEPEL